MPHEHDAPDPELNAIEAALGALSPSRSQIDRDLVMFRAGQAASRPLRGGRRGWMALAAGLALVASGEAALLAIRPRPTVVERLVVVRVPRPAEAAPEPVPVREATAASDLWPTGRDRLAGQILRYGLDGLPVSPTAGRGGTASVPSHQLLQDELRLLLNPGGPS